MFNADRGDYHEAEANHRESLRIAREVGDPVSEWVALRDIGSLAVLRGQTSAAVKVLTEALDVTLQTVLPRGSTDVLSHLGDAMLAASALDDARGYYVKALKIATKIDAPREMALAHQGIADTSSADSTEARHHGGEARRLRTDLGFARTGRRIGPDCQVMDERREPSA